MKPLEGAAHKDPGLATEDTLTVLEQPDETGEAVRSVHGSAVPPERFRPAVKGAAAFLMYLAAAILLWARPVLAHLGTRYLANGRGDVDLYRWMLAWTPWSLTHGRSILFTDRIFAPGGADLTWSTLLPGPAFLMWPVTHAFGTLATHNALKVVAPALAGWGAYLVCHRVAKAFWPSVVGGYLFGFSAYMVGQMQSHLNLVLIFPVPLAVYLVVRRIEGSLGRIAFVGLMGISLLGLFSISTELFATATLFGGLAFVLAVVAAGKERPAVLRAAALTWVAYAIVGLLLLFPYLLPAMHTAPLKPIRSPEDASVDALGFLVPRHDILIGAPTFSSVSRHFTSHVVEDGSYLGIALVLVLVAFAITERRRRGTWALLMFVVMASVLALGPVLHVRGRTLFDLPGALLAKAPLIGNATPDRLPAYTALAVGVIAAIWLARATGSYAWVRWALVLVGAAMLLPYIASSGWYQDDRTPTFFTDGTYATVLTPNENVFVITETNGEEMVWQAAADFSFRMPEGYIGPIPAPYARQRLYRGLGVEDPAPFVPTPTELSRWLEENGVSAVVLGDLARPKFEGVVRAAGLRTVYEGGGVSVWRVPSTSPATGGG